MTTEAAGEDYNKATLNDVNRQIGQTIDSALGVAENAADKSVTAAGTEPPPATNEAAAMGTDPTTEGKIHRMNQKIKNFFKNIFKKDKSKQQPAATEPKAGQPVTAAAQE